MLKVHRLVFNPFQENTYIVSNDKGEALIIDPGNYEDHENEHLINYIRQNKLIPRRLINTHGHIDHILGVAFVKEKYNLPFELHNGDNILVANAAKHAANYGFELENVPDADVDLEGVTQVILGDETIYIYQVPGHSPGSIALHSEKYKFVIVGDVLFAGSIGRTDLHGGDYDVLMKSIGSKLMTLADDTVVYPGHGPETNIGTEKRSNPFVTDFFGMA